MKVYAGSASITRNPWRWIPLMVSPVFSDRRHKLRTTCGVLVTFFRWGFYVVFV